MDSILESQRSAHEERERIVDLMTKEFLAEKKSHKAKINSDKRVGDLIDVCQTHSSLLIRKLSALREADGRFGGCLS